MIRSSSARNRPSSLRWFESRGDLPPWHSFRAGTMEDSRRRRQAMHVWIRLVLSEDTRTWKIKYQKIPRTYELKLSNKNSETLVQLLLFIFVVFLERVDLSRVQKIQNRMIGKIGQCRISEEVRQLFSSQTSRVAETPWKRFDCHLPEQSSC